jgi:hypothetical protein
VVAALQPPFRTEINCMGHGHSEADFHLDNFKYPNFVHLEDLWGC